MSSQTLPNLGLMLLSAGMGGWGLPSLGDNGVMIAWAMLLIGAIILATQQRRSPSRRNS